MDIMFDMLYNIPHDDLVAWTFWLVFALIVFQAFQFVLFFGVLRDLVRRGSKPATSTKKKPAKKKTKKGKDTKTTKAKGDGEDNDGPLLIY